MSHSIKIAGLSVTVRGKVILDLDRDVEIESGDVVAIVGSNGAGKTTFVNCVINQIPYKGSVVKDSVFDNVGILFQNNNYGDLMKVKELISIVTQKSLRDASVSKMIDEFGLRSLLDSRIGKLSQGELQRFSLALVLYRESNLLIFDELTTGLDFEKRTHLLQLVKMKTSTRTVLVVTHYFEEIVGWANKILMLDKGRIVFWGSTTEFEDAYRHDGLFLVPESSALPLMADSDFVDLCFLERYENTICAIVARDAAQTQSVESLLDKRGIRYTKRPPDFYSMYRYAQGKERGDA